MTDANEPSMTAALTVVQKILSSRNLVHVSELREGIAKNELAAEISDRNLSSPESLNERSKTPNERMIVA